MQQQMQTNQTQMTQGIMTQPPSIVTVKDQLYLSDMLSWNLLASKKAHFFAQQCMDPEIKGALESSGQMHQRHYQKIITHFQNQNQPSQNQLQ